MSTSDFAGKRLYTLAEANAVLATVRPVLESLRHDFEELNRARHDFGVYAASLRNHGLLVESHRVEVEINELVERLRGGIERLDALGIELKNIEWGLIDFPALRNGAVVYLCWRLGEGEIEAWHELDAGFAGRRPIDDGFQHKS